MIIWIWVPCDIVHCQLHPITIHRTIFWVCTVLVLSFIMCSFYYFLNRILFHHDFHHDHFVTIIGICMAVLFILNYTALSLQFMHKCFEVFQNFSDLIYDMFYLKIQSNLLITQSLYFSKIPTKNNPCLTWELWNAFSEFIFLYITYILPLSPLVSPW